mmetsp:Transcript_29256/g.61215  ORF Transcript_29256/g.61215 Transcript_29256/m.61215 type:complete len:227 (+) Transcript_29256:1549-2229(+)
MEMRDSLLYPAPHPWTRAKSFPVPSGRIAIGGHFRCFKFRESSALIIHDTVPSPPQTSMRNLEITKNDSKIGSGGPFAKSQIWIGFNNLLNCVMSRCPCCGPDRELTNTNNGVDRSSGKYSSPNTYPCLSGTGTSTDILFSDSLECAVSKKYQVDDLVVETGTRGDWGSFSSVSSCADRELFDEARGDSIFCREGSSSSSMAEPRMLWFAVTTVVAESREVVVCSC